MNIYLLLAIYNAGKAGKYNAILLYQQYRNTNNTGAFIRNLGNSFVIVIDIGNKILQIQKRDKSRFYINFKLKNNLYFTYNDAIHISRGKKDHTKTKMFQYVHLRIKRRMKIKIFKKT